MRYVVVYESPDTGERKVYSTKWFTGNQFSEELRMVVIDTHYHRYTTDGLTWDHIDDDTMDFFVN